MIASGHSKASGGYSIMSQTVGYTCAIATRLVLLNKVPQRGVLSPIYPEIYNPILDELKTMGISMEESEELIQDPMIDTHLANAWADYEYEQSQNPGLNDVISLN